MFILAVFQANPSQIQMKLPVWKRPKFHPFKQLDKDATLAALTWHPVVSDWRPQSGANEVERLVWSARALFPHPDWTVWNIKAKPKKASIISESVRLHLSPAPLSAGRGPQYKHTVIHTHSAHPHCKIHLDPWLCFVIASQPWLLRASLLGEHRSGT